MSHYEYTVVPAPRDVPRVKGVRSTDARFAFGLTGVLNDLGAEGWEYLRSDTLSAEYRSGVFGRRQTETVSVLVFRRSVETVSAAVPPPAREAGPDDGAPRIDPSRPPSLAAARWPDMPLRTVPGPGRD